MTLRGELRDVADADHEWLVRLHNDTDVLRNVTDPTPITMEQHMAWWSSVRDNPRQMRRVFAVDGERVGFTKFYNIDRVNSNCVLGADICREHRGRGMAHGMWSLMLDEVFGPLGLHRASLMTAEYNHVGIHVYKRLGFREEGRLVQSLFRDGVYHDQICMFVLATEWAKGDGQ
jgi:RimJ/RimL family protein N-acetyltransferase